MPAAAKNERIDIRTSPLAKRTLQDAATARSKTVSEFVLDAALKEADAVLAEQGRFILTGEEWSRFVQALDEPAKPKPRLEKLLQEKSVFE